MPPLCGMQYWDFLCKSTRIECSVSHRICMTPGISTDSSPFAECIIESSFQTIFTPIHPILIHNSILSAKSSLPPWSRYNLLWVTSMGVFGILKKKTLVYLEAPKSPSCPLTLLPPCLSSTEAFEATTHEPNLLKLAKDQEAAPHSPKTDGRRSLFRCEIQSSPIEINPRATEIHGSPKAGQEESAGLAFQLLWPPSNLILYYNVFNWAQRISFATDKG